MMHLVTAVSLLPLVALATSLPRDAPIPLPIPEPTGPYVVSLRHEEMTDPRGTARPDPWNPKDCPVRKTMVTHLHPVPRAHCIRTCKVPYMTEHLAKLQDEILARLAVPATWPKGNLGRLELTVCCGQLRIADPVFHPRVLIGTAWNGTRLMAQAMGQGLASLGWDVTIMDHPGESAFVEFLDGKIVLGERPGYDEVQVGKALDARMQDERMVLDRLGIKYLTDEGADEQNTKAGMVGFGFGGAATAASMLNDSRLVGGVNLDGKLLGPVLRAGLGRPNVNQSFLLFGSEVHGSVNGKPDESWVTFLDTMQRWHPEEWVKELSLMGARQESFGDLALIADLAGLRKDDKLMKALDIGNIMGSRAQEVVLSYLDSFLNMTQLGKGPGLLTGPSRRFPEVEFVD